MSEEEEFLEDEMVAPFCLLVDRGISNEVTKSLWCPTMDLLGIVNNKNEVWIQRAGSGSSWTRLKTLISSSPSQISSLSWRTPDGKAVSCAYEDGSISLFDIETGIELFSIPTHNHSVQYLRWCNKKSFLSSTGYLTREDCFQNRSLLLPQRNISMEDDDLFDSASNLTDSPLITSPTKDSFPVLCSVSKDRTTLSAFGNFTIGELDLSSHLIQSAVPNIISFEAATLSSDFQCASILTTSTTANETKFSILLLDTSLLASRKEELQNISEESFHISVLLQQSTSFLSKMTENWKNSFSSFRSKFSIYDTHLRDEGSDSSLKDDLIMLLATGISCPALDRFLCNTMKVSNMIRLARSMDSACNSIQMVSTGLLEKTIEALLFRLGELQGLSQCEQYASIGLNEKILAQCIHAAGGFILLLHKLTKETTRYRKQLQTFFQWITKMQFLLQTSSDEEATWKPINNAVIDEKLILEFLDAEMANLLIPTMLSNNKEQFKHSKESLRYELQFCVAISNSLSNSLLSVKQLCEDLFDYPSQRCSDSFRVSSIIEIPKFVCFGAQDNISGSIYFQDFSDPHSSEDYQLVSFVERTEQDVVRMLRYPTNASKVTSKDFVVESLGLRLQEEQKIEQLSLYTLFNFCVLLTENSDEETKYKLAMGNFEEKIWEIHSAASSCRFSIAKYVSNDDDFILQREREIEGEPKLLSVSEGRGVACCFCAQQRIQIFDLEDDEYPEEEEEPEE